MTFSPPAKPRLEMCRKLVDMRSAIDENLREICPGPEWDMLLELYMAEHEPREVFLWALCMVARCPPSTAHRKVCQLEAKALLRRSRSRTERRSTCVQLTPQGRDMIETLVDRLMGIWRDSQRRCAH